MVPPPTPNADKASSGASVPDLVEETAAAQELRGATGRQAGRGGLALAGGKVYFLVSGLVQQILLSHILGIGGYGALSTAQSVASISYNPLVQAGIQGVSREIASTDEASVASVQRRLLRFHFVVAALASTAFALLAGPLANFLGAPHVAGGIRILSGVLFLYGMYSPLIGYLNGRRRFLGQAGLDILAATLRTVGLVAGAYVATKWWTAPNQEPDPGIQVEGTALGFCIASVFIFLTALRMTGWGKRGGHSPPAKNYITFVLPILGGQILLNVLFQADALLLRRFAAEAASLAFLDPIAADPYVGAYRQTQLFCFLPFQLLTSVTFVLFPLLANARAQGRDQEVSGLILRGLRIALIVAGLIISTLIAVPGGLLALVFGAEAAELGADSMRILAVGMGFFAVLGVITSAMNSLGAERQSFALIGLAAILVASLCIFVAKIDDLSPRLLIRVAAATSTAMIIATACAAGALKKLFDAQLPWLTFLRTTVSVGLSGAAGAHLFQGGHLMTLLGAVATAITCLVLLVVTREVKATDWQQLKGLAGR